MGQRYQTTTYTEADGLANSMIFDIVQDSAGVLWIGRRSGISSYDGTHFYNYNISDGLRLASYAFLTIDEERPGIIWIGRCAPGTVLPYGIQTVIFEGGGLGVGDVRFALLLDEDAAG